MGQRLYTLKLWSFIMAILKLLLHYYTAELYLVFLKERPFM